MNILLVGFTGQENTSKLVLDLVTPKYYLDKLYLDSRIERGKKELMDHLEHKRYDYVIIVSMKDTLEGDRYLEFAVNAAEEQDIQQTNFLYGPMKELFAEQGITTEVLETPENTFANAIYYTALKYIREQEQKTQCLLIHLPANTKIDVMKLSLQMTKYFSALVKAK